MRQLLRFAAIALLLFALASCPDMAFRNDLARIVANSAPTLSVVYNDGSPADTTLANSIKTLMATDLTTTPGVSGTMPSVTVNLVAESSIPKTFDPTFIVAGVILVTPGSTIYTDVNRSQNIAAQGRGVFAMGAGGTQFLDKIRNNWSAWGLSGQQPDQIGWMLSAVGSHTNVLVRGTAVPGPSTGAWSYPLSSTSIPGVDGNTIALYSLSNTSVEQYNPTTAAPPNGALYGQSPSNPLYIPVVRQGRFLQYGFSAVPDLPATGEVFFVNLYSLMAKF